jgi:hypothetical protein
VTDYSDIPQVNQLYIEQQQVETAISLIDNGGTLTAFTISPPPPPPPYDPMNPVPPSPMMMDVRITNIGTVAPETLTALRAQLVERDNEITAELTSLGVTTTPPSRSLTPPPKGNLPPANLGVPMPTGAAVPPQPAQTR